MAQELLQRLQALSQTPGSADGRPTSHPAGERDSRGGFLGVGATPRDRQGGGSGQRIRGSELAAAREALERGDLPQMDERAVNAVLGLPPPLREEERRAPALRKLAPSYRTEAEALAHVLARLAPEYAVCRRVLNEVAQVMEAAGQGGAQGGTAAAGAQAGATPGSWQPHEVVDDEAGRIAAVGSVARAAQEVSPPPAPRPRHSLQQDGEPGPGPEGLPVGGSRRKQGTATNGDEAPEGAAASASAKAADDAGAVTAPVPLRRPREVLVHGAGVGAAVVAVLEALSSHPPASVTAVEPSHLRQLLGSQLVRSSLREGEGASGGDGGMAEAEALDAAAGRWSRRTRGHSASATDPRVMWVGELPPMTKTTVAKQRRRYDLVVAPYQLTLLPTAEERRQLVRQLWDRCGDVLVVLEPGTPLGFARVAEARELVLGLEARKARPHAESAAARGSGGDDDPRVASGGSPLAGGLPSVAGAHVVAPCPHDGACPMQASRRSWCHFGQSLLRPPFMRQALSRPGARGGSSADHQEENFSYVVLRRGPRPQLRVAVAREYESEAPPGYRTATTAEAGAGDSVPAADGGAHADPPSALSTGVLGSPFEPSRLPTRVVLNQVLLNRLAAAPQSGGEAAGPAEVASAVAPVAAAAAAADGPHAAATPVGGPAGGVGAAGTVGPVVAAFVAKHPAFGPGLVGRLMVLQDAGVDWAAASAATVPLEGVDDDGAAEDESPGLGPGHDSRAGQDQGSVVGAGGPNEWLDPEDVVGRPAVAAAGSRSASDANGDGARDIGGVGSGLGAGSGSSLQRLGLDASVAQLSMQLLRGRDALGNSGQSAVEDGAAAVTMAAQYGSTGVAPAPPPALPARPLRREEVSAEEYGRAERQLLGRIYGSVRSTGAAEAVAGGEAVPSVEIEGRDRNDNDDSSSGDAMAERDLDWDGDSWGDRPAGQGAQPEAGGRADDTLLLARAASHGWPRVVRPPRMRSGHVVLDLCTVGLRPGRPEQQPPPRRERQQDSGDSVADSSTHGRLLQQVVPRSARDGWMGAPAYRLARSLRWGDVWPDWYVRDHNTRPGRGQARLDERRQQAGEAEGG